MAQQEIEDMVRRSIGGVRGQDDQQRPINLFIILCTVAVVAITAVAIVVMTLR